RENPDRDLQEAEPADRPPRPQSPPSEEVASEREAREENRQHGADGEGGRSEDQRRLADPAGLVDESGAPGAEECEECESVIHDPVRRENRLETGTVSSDLSSGDRRRLYHGVPALVSDGDLFP